jgi:ribosome-associated protein
LALNPAAAPRAVAPVDDAEVAELHALILKSLDDDQAVEVVSIPLAGKTSIADHMVIASGRSSRQVASMAAKIAERIKQDLHRSVRIEGLPTADWVLIDAQDVVVHLFRPEVRHFYNLEKMWTFDGPSGSTSDRRAPPKIVAETADAPFDTDPEGHDEALANEPGIDDA